MKSPPSLLGLFDYARRRLQLAGYLAHPGDGRRFPQIPAATLLTALLGSKLLREPAFLATEHLVQHAAPALGVAQGFSHDTSGYFTARLDVGRLRAALGTVLQRAKRNKAFAPLPRLGLAIDGSGMGRSQTARCALCHPQHNAQGEVSGYGHKLVGVSVVAGALTLPLDVEYYGPEEGELTAAKRLLTRVVGAAGVRFDFVVADGLYPGAPFLHLAETLKLPVVARLTAMLPELCADVEARFATQPPTAVYRDVTEPGDRVECWDAADFIPWQGLQWPAVRVLRYRQYRRDGTVIAADWLTNFASRQVGTLALYRIGKSRWQIENRFFNDGKNRYGLEHIPHHHANAVLVNTLLTCLAICLERLYRLRYLHRGGRRPYTAIELVRLWRLALGAPAIYDTS